MSDELLELTEPPKSAEPPKVIDLNKPTFDTLEAFFPSEHPERNETQGEDEEIRRKRFFGSEDGA